MRTHTVTIRDDADVLATIPYRLGFRPECSVVVVAVDPGPPDRMGLVVRTDTADLAEPRVGTALARSLAGHLARTAPVGVLTATYTDLGWSAASDDPAVRTANRRLRAAFPVPVLHSWVVAADGWGHLEECPCCDPGGRDLAELVGTAVEAELVVAGESTVPRRTDLRVTPTRSTGRAAAAAAAAADEVAVKAALRRPGNHVRTTEAATGTRTVEEWRLAALVRWSALLAATTPDATELGRAAVTLEDKTVRDAVVAAAVSDALPVDAMLDPEAVHRVFDESRRPRPTTVRRCSDLLAAVASHAPPGRAAAALGAAAFLAWWAGEGARADVLAHQSREDSPGNRLAELVVSALDSGAPPPWARAGADLRR